MELSDVMQQLQQWGSPQTVKIYRNHGADGEMFGVKIGDMKKLLPKLKGRQQLAMELWDTQNSDAMYLASLIADGAQMTKTQLNQWARSAWWYMLSECAVPYVAAEHPDGVGLARKWMKARRDNVASSGWSTYTTVVSVWDDQRLDMQELSELLQQAEQEVHTAPNRVRLCMNGFVIATGAFVAPMLEEAKAVAERIGKVDADMGKTSCKIPVATESIAKVERMGRVGKKRKSTKC